MPWNIGNDRARVIWRTISDLHQVSQLRLIHAWPLAAVKAGWRHLGAATHANETHGGVLGHE
jgi:hypothetical protein